MAPPSVWEARPQRGQKSCLTYIYKVLETHILGLLICELFLQKKYEHLPLFGIEKSEKLPSFVLSANSTSLDLDFVASRRPRHKNLPAAISFAIQRNPLTVASDGVFLTIRGSIVSIQTYGRVPFIPAKTLRHHKALDRGDDRFRSAARLQQTLYREQNGWRIGSYTTARGTRRKLGNYLTEAAASEGANFISPDIAKLARLEVAYREDGALFDEARLNRNLLSSHPATLNFFGGLKLDLDLATAAMQSIAPDFVGEVTEVLFEHSPARRHPAFTNCRTAFDVFLKCTTIQHQNGFIAVELKLSETLQEPPPTLRSRHDELSRLSGLYKDPDHPALRSNPLQQFFRQHLLAYAMILNGLATRGRFIVVAPKYNLNVQDALAEYRQHLANTDDGVEFDSVTFDDLVRCIHHAGAKDIADALHARYCSFDAVDALI